MPTFSLKPDVTARIVLSGGGTGGHLFPLVAVARQLAMKAAAQGRPLELHYVGPKPQAASTLTNEGVVTHFIFAGKLPRYYAWRLPWELVKLPISFVQTLVVLLKLMPDAVFAKGGYGSVPVALVAWLYRIPVFVHESDTIPGLANRIIAHVARRIAVAFPDAARFFRESKVTVTGNPLRRPLLEGSAARAREIFAIRTDKPILLILGGSQGAEAINDLVVASLRDLLIRYEVIHQVGEATFERVSEEAKVEIGTGLETGYHARPFLSEAELADAYAAASLIISRAGSGLFEIAALGKPAILIPLPSAAQDHQRENAYAYAHTGAALILEQGNLTPHLFAERISSLLEHPETTAQMDERAKAFAKIDADEKVAEEVWRLAVG
ncbi:UDP-N-acetylglucosamine--N-acetylmuramyl-(pentapeptide) pyrophosphoryl-undecaprenol N-acetylglucosamine transferase [Candidatus Parcubacteria bacterium]|nr:UDP-N-acetylglucosamine--N-acetylmuramyl-(pentapeptide) pyrophosphoryl-undecaprenol N-acetylglucosamine transferase [Candidatus Parcubacteria bacterium]